MTRFAVALIAMGSAMFGQDMLSLNFRAEIEALPRGPSRVAAEILFDGYKTAFLPEFEQRLKGTPIGQKSSLSVTLLAREAPLAKQYIEITLQVEGQSKITIEKFELALESDLVRKAIEGAQRAHQAIQERVSPRRHAHRPESPGRLFFIV